MPTTYESIATTTLTTSATDITFSNISGTYTDLILIVTGTVTSGNANNYIRFNSDTGNNYSYTGVGGSGGAAVSARASNGNGIQTEYYGYFDQSIATRIIHIMNYSNTTTYKTAISRGDNSNNGSSISVGTWRSTSAITSVAIVGGTLASGCTATLYGIKAA